MTVGATIFPVVPKVLFHTNKLESLARGVSQVPMFSDLSGQDGGQPPAWDMYVIDSCTEKQGFKQW